jgi:hypothetical protein
MAERAVPVVGRGRASRAFSNHRWSITAFSIEVKMEKRGYGRSWIKRGRLCAAVLAAIALGGAAVVQAGVPNIFSTGQTLRATDLNGNFDALDQRIAALEARLGTRSAFRVRLSTNNVVPIPDQTPATPLLFDATPDFDLNGEVSNDGSKTTFTAKTGGYYFFVCSPTFESGSPGAATGWGAAVILVNGAGIGSRGHYGDFWTSTRTMDATLHLSAGDKVTCGADQQASGAARIVRSGSSFEGVRLPL